RRRWAPSSTTAAGEAAGRAGPARGTSRRRRRRPRRARDTRPRSAIWCSDCGPCLRVAEVDLGDLQLGGLEDLDELVPEQLLLLDQRVRDLLDRLLVVGDQGVRGDVGLSEE